MTLKEKFEEILIAFWTSEWENECEQTADDFAIGFAEWCLKNRLFHQFIITQKIDKELLEIYKKEKGL